jgi:hypothetical protein
MSLEIRQGNQTKTSASSDYNALVFFFNQMINKKHTMTLVQVKQVNDDNTVNVQPLVTMLDAKGLPHSYGLLYSLPFVRLQGGNSAIICDPQVNDIGLAIFADRDITNVIETKAESGPNSYRVMSMSDGVYLSGLLNADPTQYIKFNGGFIDILSALTQISGNLSVQTGATGSFTSPTGQVITVNNGVVVNIT